MIQAECLTAADRIGYQICRDAIWDAGYCNWMGWAPQVSDNSVTTYAWQSLGPTVYDGTAGIAWFLAQLAQATGSDIHRRTAIGACEHALKHHLDAGPRNAAGFFSGSLGCAVTALHVGGCLQIEKLRQAGLNLLKSSAHVAEELESDVIGGSAGAIPLLIGIGQQLGNQSLLDLPEGHAKRLLSLATRQLIERNEVWEMHWKSPAFERGLTGYSHGAAGFANALLEIYYLFGGNAYLSAAREALTFERRRFNVEQQNWLDLRSEGEAPAVAGCAWCHGAAGIGLARLRTLALLQDDPSIANEIHTAMATTTQSLKSIAAPGTNLSLCHGHLGNIELILAAQEKNIEIQGGLGAVEDVINVVIAQSPTDIPWKCGTQDGRTTPGLMLGTAGIGSMFLRYSDSRYGIPLVLTPELVCATFGAL